MNRILYVSPVGCIGGAERILLESIREVRRLRPDWQLSVVMLAEGPLRQALADLGAHVEVVALPAAAAAKGDSPTAGTLADPANASVKPARAWRPISAGLDGMRFLRFLSQLRTAIKRLNPDLIHSNGIKSHLCLALALRPRCPIVWHIHDFVSHRPQWVQRLIRWASGRASVAIAISRAVERDIAGVAPRLPVQHVENAVDTQRFVPGTGRPRELDREAGLDPDVARVRIGLVATYANWKGQDVFLKAIQRCPTVSGYVIGGPIYTTAGSQWAESDLRQQAESLGISDRVGWIGFQSDPVWIYQSLDVVVHASTRPEPFGLTIVEAMACGRAVIVSNSGGAAELFTPMHDAVGHPPGDVNALAHWIGRLADDAGLRNRLGENARKTVLQRFASDRFGRELIAAYTSVLTSSTRQPVNRRVVRR